MTIENFKGKYRRLTICEQNSTEKTFSTEKTSFSEVIKGLIKTVWSRVTLFGERQNLCFPGRLLKR